MGGKQDIIYIHTQTSETIYATSVAFIASTTRMISQALFGDSPFPADPPSWLQLHKRTISLTNTVASRYVQSICAFRSWLFMCRLGVAVHYSTGAGLWFWNQQW